MLLNKKLIRVECYLEKLEKVQESLYHTMLIYGVYSSKYQTERSYFEWLCGKAHEEVDDLHTKIRSIDNTLNIWEDVNGDV